ncbi:hypothetical protein HDU98_002137 [Podochytrium sp. JEL0797]|nr:hypothetical protein HDU98_002137 [Podochytrium sp. JEL0797]
MPLNKPITPIDELKAKGKSIKENFPQLAKSYVSELFPIASWLPRYSSSWFLGDFIAGLTVALVVIPQSIAYATKLANLPAEYGLYSSFIGVLVYALFATSKDVSVGPTAVLSLVTGQAIIFQLLLGVLRLGMIVDFVPVPVISGFTSGAGLQIIIGQLPALCGIKGINTNNSPYRVLGDFLQKLNSIGKYDAIFGFSALFLILGLKYGCRAASTKYPFLKYVNFLRNTIAMVIFTGISYSLRNKSINLTIVGTIPYGLSGIVQPNLGDSSLTSSVFQAMPGILILSLLEHVAVSKSYGRLNGYTPNANQELVAMGLSNMLGSFVGAYPATGSFSRSAIQSSSGSRTPLAAFVTGIIVIISLFTITPALYYIPNASLAAIVCAAISELLANFKILKSLYRVELLDFVGFWIALVVTFFASIEVAIYASVAFSLIVLLVRIARPKIKILSRTSTGIWFDAENQDFDYDDCTLDTQPVPGILVFRPEESMTYPNSTFLLTRFKALVVERFSYTGTVVSTSERVWNDDMQEKMVKRSKDGIDLPPLRAVVFDFSAVNHIDYTGLQTLLDCKEDLERFAGRSVPFHFTHVRRSHVKVLWNVPGGGVKAASVDATPGVPSPASPPIAPVSLQYSGKLSVVSMESMSKLQTSVKKMLGRGGRGSRNPLDDWENGKYFHFSIDAAIAAADEQTREVDETALDEVVVEAAELTGSGGMSVESGGAAGGDEFLRADAWRKDGKAVSFLE